MVGLAKRLVRKPAALRHPFLLVFFDHGYPREEAPSTGQIVERELEEMLGDLLEASFRA
jgi:hypothetical protein